jgi:hypothetical protein
LLRHKIRKSDHAKQVKSMTIVTSAAKRFAEDTSVNECKIHQLASAALGHNIHPPPPTSPSSSTNIIIIIAKVSRLTARCCWWWWVLVEGVGG